MFLPKIFLSCDDVFFEFARPVVLAWRKFFPHISISLTLVSNNTEKLSKLEDLDIELQSLPLINGFPVQNLAKLGRLFSISSEKSDLFGMIEDIDTAPLQSKFLNRIFSEITTDRLVAVGHEVYKDMCFGKFPMSNFCGPVQLFKELINPNNLLWENWIASLSTIVSEDGKERPQVDPSRFSDESTIRKLINITAFGDKIKKVERQADIYNEWIDRSWWNIDMEKLYSEKYILVNFLRPCINNFYNMKPVFDFIYNKDTKIDDI